jgi:hypothetical protein
MEAFLAITLDYPSSGMQRQLVFYLNALDLAQSLLVTIEAELTGLDLASYRILEDYFVGEMADVCLPPEISA